MPKHRIEPLDRAYLSLLVDKRDVSVVGFTAERAAHSAYYQGRIDEYCAQNAIDQADAPDLDLQLNGDVEA